MNNYFKIKALLTFAERKSALVLLILMIVGMILETLGVGLIVPLVIILMQEDLVTSYPKMALLINLLGNPSQTELIFMAMLGMVSIYFTKNTFLAFLHWKQIQFAYDVQKSLSQRLFEIYLHQPYTFHLQRNSSQLISNITAEVGIFSNVVSSLMVLSTEIMVLLGIGILVIIVEPFGSLLIILLMGFSAWLFNFLTRNHISRWGKERQFHNDLRIQHVQQGLSGVKDVKLLGRENEFLKQFYIHNAKSAHVWKLQYTLQGIPRLMFELIVVIALSILVITMVSHEKNKLSIIPFLGLFATAAFRLLPSISKVLSAIQSLKFNSPVVNTLYLEMLLKSSDINLKNKPESMLAASELSVTDLTYIYPNAILPAISKVSINIRKGQSVGLIGSTGSGKSTLVDVILGLLTPCMGVVEVNGVDIKKNLRRWQNQIGYVPQSIYLTDDTLKKNVAFGIPNNQIDDLAVQAAIAAAQLDKFVSTLPEKLETLVGERGVRLSGGQRQRIGIARALYHNPTIIVLDEATSALDSETESEVMDAIFAMQKDKMIIIVAHRLSTIKNCDRIYQLESGKIIGEGLPDEIFSNFVAPIV
jgi:ABC-type multidrug transport system fused ATPase/permease subunit